MRDFNDWLEFIQTQSEKRTRSLHEQDVRGDAPTISSLRQALSDPSPSVRRRATLALGEIEDADALPSLCGLLLRDPEPEVRRAAAEALELIRDARAVRSLCVAVRDHDPETRWIAAEALGKIGDRRALKTLLDAADANDSALRRHTLMALGRMGSRRAVPTLHRALNDSYEVSVAAAEALLMIANSHPHLKLRSALPMLRHYSILHPEASAYRYAVQAIENATDALAELPVPAQSPSLDEDELPIPSEKPIMDAEILLNPSSEVQEED
jgi:HEAT repeat protein